MGININHDTMIDDHFGILGQSLKETVDVLAFCPEAEALSGG